MSLQTGKSRRKETTSEGKKKSTSKSKVKEIGKHYGRKPVFFVE